MKNVKSVIRLRDRSGRTRQLSVDEALAEGSRILSAGDYGNALLVLEKAVRAAPFSAPARHLLGAAQANAGNLKDASLNLRKAVEAQPNNAAYRTALAQALMQLNPSEAVPHFLTAILLGSTSPDVFINLGIILLDLRSDEDALKVCDLGLAACSEHFGILMNRAAWLFVALVSSRKRWRAAAGSRNCSPVMGEFGPTWAISCANSGVSRSRQKRSGRPAFSRRRTAPPAATWR